MVGKINYMQNTYQLHKIIIYHQSIKNKVKFDFKE